MSEISQVVAFDRVVKEGSFTAAARALGLAKSTVSERVAALEQRLGVQLLQRTTRTMGLTDDGAAYHARCHRALAELRQAGDALQDRGSVPQGLLRVTAPRLFGHAFLGDALSEYLARWPEVQLELMLVERRVDLVEEGFDVALRIGSLPDSTLRKERLGEAQMVHVASPAYLERCPAPASPSELAGHQLILVGDRPGLRWPFRGPGGPEVFQGTERLLLNSLVMAKQAAVAGAGIAWLPSFLAADALHDGRLRALLRGFAPPALPIFALTPGGRFLSAKVRAFLDLLAERVAAEAPWEPRAPRPGA